MCAMSLAVFSHGCRRGRGTTAKYDAAAQSAVASSTSWSTRSSEGPPQAPEPCRAAQRPRCQRGGRRPPPTQVVSPLGATTSRAMEVQKGNNTHVHADMRGRGLHASGCRREVGHANAAQLHNPLELPVFICCLLLVLVVDELGHAPARLLLPLVLAGGAHGHL